MKQALILIRFTAYLLIWGGVFCLIRNLTLSYDSFNPSYWVHYFKQELLSPLLISLFGLMLRLRAGSIARHLTSDSKSND